MLRIALTTLVLSLPAQASITDQEILLAVPTPSTQSPRSVVEIAEIGPNTSRFTLGAGSGVNSFTGNLGKLYRTSEPVVELRGDWAFLPAHSVHLGGEFAKYSFSAEPNGSVGVSTQTLRIQSQEHFLSTALVAEGWDPYLAFAAEAIWRTQTFQSHNSVEKDNALGLSGGLGTNYVLRGGKIALWAEAGLGQIFFGDRHEQEYLESGIEDQKGLRYSGRLGMKYLF